MAWGRAICMLKCNTVYLARYRSMRIPVSFRTAYARADKQILVDSGATDNFIHPRLIRRLGLGTQHLPQERKIWNIDGTANKAGMISEFVDLHVTFSFRPTICRYIGLPSSLSPPSSHRASVLLRSHLTDAIPSCCLLSCTIFIWCCDTISHV